jgi:hypothetical protein
MVLAIENRVFLVEHVFRNGGKYTEEVIRQYVLKFPDSQVPHRNAVRNLIDKFRATGSVVDAYRSGRPSTSEDTMLDIQARITMSPNKSLRQLSQQVHLPMSTVHKILKSKLHFRPYRLTDVSQLHERDYQSRLNYCMWFQNFISEQGDEILDLTFFTDEAWFHLSGYVNSQNNRLWSSENPHELYQVPLHDQKVGVWCAISRMRIIGPIFFNATINAERYRTLILEPFIAHLTEREIKEAWFQQDGATAHTAATSLNYLEGIFANRIISRGIWPARSPDLTPPDYYLWGALKGKVYENNPQTVNDLKAEIVTQIQQISPAIIRKVFENMKRRVNTCLEARGGHFQHML